MADTRDFFTAGLARLRERVKPYPFSYSVGCDKRNVDVFHGDILVGQLEWTPENPEPLKLRMVDLGGDEVVFVFIGLNERKARSEWINQSVHRSTHEEVSSMWMIDVTKTNELAHKLYDETIANAGPVQEEDIKRIINKLCANNSDYKNVPMFCRAAAFVRAVDRFPSSEYEVPRDEKAIEFYIEKMLAIQKSTLEEEALRN